jgi:hypothetical protein
VLDDAMTKKVHFTRVTLGCLVALVAVSALAGGAREAVAAGHVRHADFEPDYEASGFVRPAGMPSPETYFRSVEQAGFFGNGPIAARLGGQDSFAGHGTYAGPVSYESGGYGEPYGYSDGSCGPDGYECGDCGCGHGCGLFGGCGLLGCGHGGCLSRLRGMCMFCGGAGCGVCQSIGRGYLLGALHSLMPYAEGGLSTQRWYDLSADLMFLQVSGGAPNQVVTTRDIEGTPVLFASDANQDYSVGGRISGAFICGPGGNIEVTYLGGNRWSGEGVATGAGDLYSFLSEFGRVPQGGFDDTDRSNVQRVAGESTFHSGEVNYRRRTVGPYGRFQWSGLGGIRYLRFDDDFAYSAVGNAGFFNLDSRVDNEMVGVQSGGDLWWNLVPGINLGIGLKGGPMGNRIKRRSVVASNSLGPGATPATLTAEDYVAKTAWLSELEATMLYRLSHSWTLKTQYYVLNVDRVGFGYDRSAAESLLGGGVQPIDSIQTRSLTINGFSIGAEYIW